MRNFISLKAKDVENLLEVKEKEGKDAIILAGGTNVSNYIKQGKISTGTLVDISQISTLKKISETDGMLKIGAGVTITEIILKPSSTVWSNGNGMAGTFCFTAPPPPFWWEARPRQAVPLKMLCWPPRIFCLALMPWDLAAA